MIFQWPKPGNVAENKITFGGANLLVYATVPVGFKARILIFILQLFILNTKWEELQLPLEKKM